jgi:hypothetical protein
MPLAVSISNDQIIILNFLFENIFFLFDRCPDFERFGVYSDNVFYYLSTNPDINVVKHFLDEGKRVKEIEGCKIPNRHLRSQYTRHLQG